MQSSLVKEAPPLAQDAKQTDMRTLILECAFRLFVDRGFEGVSMRALAKEVGIITPGGLYHHFPDKKSLHAASLDYAFKQRSKPAVTVLQDKTLGTPRERLQLFILRLCERFYYDRQFQKLLQRLRLEWAEGRYDEKTLAVYGRPLTILEDFLDELDVDPAYNKRTLTNLIYALITHTYDSAAIRASMPGANPELDMPEQVSKEIWRLLEGGIFSTP